VTPSQISSAQWLLLVFSLPSKNGSLRVNIWRKLKRSGALALPTSGYLLPNTPDNMERFEWLSAEIRKYKGKASVAQVQSFDDLSDERIIQRFTAARDGDYQKMLRKLKSKPTAQHVSAVRRKLVEISAIDFFESPLRRKVENAITSVDGGETKKAGKIAKGKTFANRTFANRTWLTRHRPGIDRCASAWLIQQFIDPKARFTFGNDPKHFPEAVPFDMYGDVGFGHRGDDCTFETLCAEFSLRELRLKTIAEIVHDADLHDDKFGRPEGAAIDRVLKGWAKQEISDNELIRKGMELFEGLYEGLAVSNAKTKKG
jgi:hypothetical protein